MTKEYLAQVEKSIIEDTFVKAGLGKYRGREKGLQKIIFRLVEISNERMLSLTYRFETKDFTKNFSIKEGIAVMKDNLGKDFMSAFLHSIHNDFDLISNRRGQFKIQYNKPSYTKIPPRTHDKQKVRVVESQNDFLYHLGICTKEGKVKADKQGKYRQINKFIEIFEAQFKNTDAYLKDDIKIVDMGSGKSYLTFALYDYIVNKTKTPCKIVGIEQRKELVDFSNELAEKCGFKRLVFEHSPIQEANLNGADIMVALHACDTATDDAILNALESKVELMILAPCCQHYVRGKINPPDELGPIFKNGIHKEQLSVLLTDTLRSLTLEAFAYNTKVFEFISSEHTAKNIMITACLNKNLKFNHKKINEINSIKSQFGIPDYYLDEQVFE